MSSVPQKYKDATKDILAKLEFRIEQYFSSIKSKLNMEIYDYIKKVHEPELRPLKGIAKIPNKKGGFYEVPYRRMGKTKLEVELQGLPFDSVYIEFIYPKVMFGERNIVPQLKFTVEAPVAYPGSFGLVWEALINESIVPKFHPITDLNNKFEDLVNYYEDGVVDMFCDILNRGDYSQVETLNEMKNQIADGVLKNYFNYKVKGILESNFIQIPIYGLFNAGEEKHTISVDTWAYGGPKRWIPLQEVVLHMFYPLTSIISMFDREGEFIDGAEPAPIEDVKADLRHISDKEKAYDRGWDPFKTQEKVKRDEFGFIIRKDDEGGIGTRDLSSARKSLWEIQKDLEKKRKKDMAQAGPANQNIINYPSAKEFFAKNQMKRFIVKGSYSHLPFSEKSKIEIMKACKPPFVLKFARDKIRLKKRVTSRKAIELIFEVYNMGYLVPTK